MFKDYNPTQYPPQLRTESEVDFELFCSYVSCRSLIQISEEQQIERSELLDLSIKHNWSERVGKFEKKQMLKFRHEKMPELRKLMNYKLDNTIRMAVNLQTAIFNFNEYIILDPKTFRMFKSTEDDEVIRRFDRVTRIMKNMITVQRMLEEELLNMGIDLSKLSEYEANELNGLDEGDDYEKPTQESPEEISKEIPTPKPFQSSFQIPEEKEQNKEELPYLLDYDADLDENIDWDNITEAELQEIELKRYPIPAHLLRR